MIYTRVDRIAFVEWTDNQSPFGKEPYNLSWYVPPGVVVQEAAGGLEVTARGFGTRLHPWARVKHVDYAEPEAIDMGGAPPPTRLPDSVRVVSATIDGEPVPVTEQVIREGDTVTVSKDAGVRVEPKKRGKRGGA